MPTYHYEESLLVRIYKRQVDLKLDPDESEMTATEKALEEQAGIGLGFILGIDYLLLYWGKD